MEQPVTSIAIQAALALGLPANWATNVMAIEPALRDISATIRRSARQRAALNRKLPLNQQLPIEHAMPYGISSDLLNSWPQVLAMSDDPRVLAVLAAYRRIPKTLANHLPIEAFCVAAGFPPENLLGEITRILVRQGAAASAIITAINQPRVIQKTIDRALEDDGFDDRKLFHQATGFLPTPQRGVNVRVDNHQPAAPAPVTNIAIVPTPAPSDVLKSAVTSLQEARADKTLDVTATSTPAPMPAAAVAPQAAPTHTSKHAFLDSEEDD